MDATILQHLVWYLPPEVKNALAEDAVLPQTDHITMSSAIDAETLSFIAAYRDLSFGWKFAEAMARYRKPFPCILEGEDEALFRAYLYCCNSDLYRSDSLTGARALAFGPMAHVRQTVEAMLLCVNATVDDVADTLKLDREVVSTYEKLFFNVLDRKADAHFIAEVVYPQGRIVEYSSGYADQATLGSQIRRAGYNNGPAHVLQYAGYHNDLLKSLAGADSASKFENEVMANGLFLAANGHLNKGRNASGINHARVVLAAAKQGGQAAPVVSNFSSVGGAIMAEMVQIKLVDARQAAEYKKGRNTATKAE